ncbi:hypothetical protein SAMD00023353_0102820 [Rosellinia necatrix]|uniref:Uncharacterized protein n=1 Tax=Rosellinia necatrix TaxID=77044 RepID=A0A1S8A4P8_ROSNE|nr:hypothetical protein SAMD00023353_0102820 [Rosellinia necatrix]
MAKDGIRTTLIGPLRNHHVEVGKGIIPFYTVTFPAGYGQLRKTHDDHQAHTANQTTNQTTNQDLSLARFAGRWGESGV